MYNAVAPSLPTMRSHASSFWLFLRASPDGRLPSCCWPNLHSPCSWTSRVLTWRVRGERSRHTPGRPPTNRADEPAPPSLHDSLIAIQAIVGTDRTLSCRSS